MGIREAVEAILEAALDISTADLFPSGYAGCREIEALGQGEDAILGAIKDVIRLYFQNRNIRTYDRAMVEQFEAGLNITPTSQSLEQRRARIIAVINTRFVLNDAKLHELCQSYLPGFTVYERTDPRALTLGVYTTEDGEDGDLPAVEIVDEIRPIVPQNLALFAGVESQIECTAYSNHAHFSSLRASLGEVEYRGDTTGFEEIAQPTVGYISQPETFLYIPQPEPGTMDARYSFTMISQPTLATFARGDTFEAITQPTIGYMDIT
jgi:hypothetical protein